ncbi:MAG: hypothetical protein AB7G37_19530 [Solirubrobacteraceae bacterium]
MIPFKLLRLSLSTLKQYRALPEERRVALREDAQRVRELTLRLGGGRVRQMLAGDGLLGPPSAPARETGDHGRSAATDASDGGAPVAAPAPGEPSEAETIEELRAAIATLGLSIARTGLVGGSRGGAVGRRVLESGVVKDRLGDRGPSGSGKSKPD